MKKLTLLLFAGTLAVWTVCAHAQAGAQAGATTQSKTSASGSKSGAQGSTSGSTSASASAQAGKNSASLSSGTTFEAALAGSLDARHNKVGDQVVARTTHDVKSAGHVVIPKGSKLIGHVTEAKARSKEESESALGIVFDRAVLKHGQEMPLHVAVQALAAAESAASADTSEAMGSVMGSGSAGTTGSAGGGASRSGGLVGGVGSTAGAAVGAATNTAGSMAGNAGRAVGATANTATGAAASTTGNLGGANIGGALNSTSTGVIGLKGLSLNSEASNATQGSLIVSSTRNVHLDSGTRMLFRAEKQ